MTGKKSADEKVANKKFVNTENPNSDSIVTDENNLNHDTIDDNTEDRFLSGMDWLPLWLDNALYWATLVFSVLASIFVVVGFILILIGKV